MWSDPARAQELGRERARLSADVGEIDRATKGIADAAELLDLAESENDEPAARDIESDAQRLEADVRHLELKRMFSGKMDSHNAFLDIQAGAGGTEAQDWAQMLLRMYLRWAAGRGFSAEVIDSNPGEVAGMKSATVEVKGEYAYGWLRTETGVHRLVRKSPFDSGNRPHTSFASVFIYPDIDETIKVEIDDKDLRIDVMRSGGAGGQHVNKTESAVRVTHIPTGIAVHSDGERSQHKNKSTAMRILRSKLFEVEQKKQEEKMGNIHAQKKAIEWGSQIRSYVLAPYKQANDHRTGLKVGNVDAVLDGDIDQFMVAMLLELAGDPTAHAKKPAVADDDEV